MNVHKKIENEKVISFGDIMFVKSIANLINSSILPSAAQSKRLIKIYHTAEDAGIIFD